MRSRAGIVVVLAVAAASFLAQAQTSGVDPEMKRLGEMITRRDIADTEVADAVGVALKSVNPKVRAAALSTLTARVVISGTAGRGQSAAELLALRSDVLGMAGDPDARVREAVPACLAILDGFSAVLTTSATPRLLREDARKVLAARFGQESNSQVRVSIVRVLGSGPTSPPGGWRGDEATILGALQDPDEWVRAAAARVVGQQQIESGLLGLVKMTSDPAVEPRSQAAQALQHFPGVKPYLPELEAALARETNQVVRGSLSAAIALIRR